MERVDLDPAARTRATIIVVGSAAIFLLVLLLSLRTPGRAIASGIANAYLGPVVAILVSARHFTRTFSGYTSAPFDFAGFIAMVWNENQPVLAGFYGGSIALIVLLVIVAMTKESEDRGSATLIQTLIVIAGTAVSFLAFFSLTRLVVAIVDPISKDPIVLSYGFTSLGEAAQTVGSRLILATVASLATVIVLLVSIVLSFVLRPPRGRLLALFLALIVMLAGAWLERTWCEVLKTTALTGRFPDTFLTR